MAISSQLRPQPQANGTAPATATMGPTMKNHSKAISALPFPCSARNGLGPSGAASAGEDLAGGSFGCLDRLLGTGHLLAYRRLGLDADVAIPGASAQGREQIGALGARLFIGVSTSPFTELLRLDCGGYIVSEITSAVLTTPLVIPQMRYQLPKIVSLFGCVVQMQPTATTGSVPARTVV